MKKSLVLALLLLLCLAGVQTAAAQDPLVPQWQFDDVRIKYQWVDVAIADQIATTHIEMEFVNDGDRVAEGTYLFPLPPGAAVTELTMWVDGQPIEANLLGAGEARRIYDEIVRQLRDPALLEYVGTDAIQANVFPIPPGESRRVEIEYKHVLEADNGLVRYAFPQSSSLYTNRPIQNQRIRVELLSDDPLRAIYSPTHPVDISRNGEFAAVIGYEANDVTPDTDFELYYSVSAEAIGLNLLSYKQPGEDGTFLLLAAPSIQVDEVVAKDVLLVFDTSGSMDGPKLRQAQDAARYIVGHLNPQDRFNIVSFSTGVRNYQNELMSAGNPGQVEQFIDGLQALGGTNISQALLEAVTQADPNRPTTLIFLTDGLATEGIVETGPLLQAVAQNTPPNVRIFAFGVGDDVDTFLLDSLTANHGGATTYVRPNQQLNEIVSAFFAKVNTPVLTDIALDFGGVQVEQLYPDNLPDLFAGSQLVLTGRYREGGPATITLTGLVNGEEQRFVYPDNTFRTQGGDDFIPRLWATRAIGNLMTQIRLQGESAELVRSVINLSTRYGIMTPYTSFLITEDDIFSQAQRDEAAVMQSEAMERPAPVTGAAAVETAMENAEMAVAEVVVTEVVEVEVVVEGTLSPGSASTRQQEMRFVGSKTFLSRDGVWIDTAFDSDTMTPQPVGFLSDAYFALIDAAPVLADYFATGERVLVVYDGVAYEVVDEAEGGAVTIPDVVSAETTPVIPDDNETDSAEVDAVPVSGNCAAALIAPLLLLGAAAYSRRP
ncbi:MAG: VWA domain-containing protein [Anaerolineae bacterium]|nr:VWA domain-containing protein [Anaerolineae bacterium]